MKMLCKSSLDPGTKLPITLIYVTGCRTSKKPLFGYSSKNGLLLDPHLIP